MQRTLQTGRPGIAVTHQGKASDPATSLLARSPAEAATDAIGGGGQPLPAPLRAWFEPRLGRDLRDVHLHTGTRAEEAASSINALAYTTRSHIVFGPGQYQPSTTSGRRLLAHELVHVFQQGAMGDALLRQSCPESAVDEPDHALTCTDVARDPGELEVFAAIGPVTETLVPNECLLLSNLSSGRTDFGAPPELEELADRLSLDPTATIHLTGYTDCIGRPDLNANLRANRAAAMEEYLGDVLNVDRDRVLVETAPPTEYVDSNETAEGRARNRGVLIRLETGAPPPTACRPPYDVTYAPSSVNCAAYQSPLAKNWLTYTYRHNAECACENTPDNPRNNCVRKCLQEKMHTLLVSQQRGGGVIGTCMDPLGLLDPLCPEPLCSTLYQHHADCYRDCCCGRAFIGYPAFWFMCEAPWPCQLVDSSISLANPCT